jgi:hypothetical protein
MGPRRQEMKDITWDDVDYRLEGQIRTSVEA